MEGGRVHHADCFDFLPTVERESIDLAIIDPPYNLKKAAWDDFGSHDEFMAFSQRWIDLVIPTLKPEASLYIFNTPLNSAFLATYLVSKGLFFRNWITWDKRDGFVGGTRRFAPTQETILYFSCGARPYFDADSVRVPYLSTARIAHARRKGILKNGKRWFPNEKGKLCTDVWHITSERHKTKVSGKIVKASHETPKPEELISRIVIASSKVGDCVLDCFSGSGTTAFVALANGRRFVGCEKNEHHVKLSNERLLNVGSICTSD